MSSATPSEPLAPAPTGSRWGRNAARVYLALAALAAVFVARELAVGHAGLGTTAIGVLTAPWSMLLANLGPVLLPPGTPPGVIRGIGLAVIVIAALLNARIVYGIAARAERDARARTPSGGSMHG